MKTKSMGMPAPQARILVVLMGSLGDVIRGLAIVDQLKRNFAGVRIAWLVEPACSAMVRLHSGIDQIFMFERKKPLRGVLKLARDLRSYRADILLDMQRHLKSGFFSWLSGARRRIGFHRKDCKEGNWLFSTETIPEFGEDAPKIDHYLSFIQHLGGQVKEPLDFGLSVAASQNIPEIIHSQQKPMIGLVLGSSWESKNWINEGYQRLISMLLARKREVVVLFGDTSQAELAAQLYGAIGDDSVINLAGKTSLKELLGAISRMRVMAGPDSGPAHIASALKVPYVALFGPTSATRVAPYNNLSRAIVSDIGCAPCYRRKCPGLNRLCMRLITPELVYSRVIEALSPDLPGQV